MYQLTCNDHPGSVTDLSLAISGNACVIANVLMPDVGDSQLCTVIEDANCSWGLDGICIFVPQNLRCWGALSLAI